MVAKTPDPLADFAAGYPFDLDDFQVRGVQALLAGRSALVAAPTGAGKTVVGEFAVWHALQRGGKCFYTTPIKALSNQKFADLSDRHGAERVGLLTGDNAINGDAPIVVMTTEVLRNMLYEGSRTLVGLHYVVLDEVHYLSDRERGAVWEEVIVQLAPSVQLACLSATVSNAEDFGAWLRSVRDTCDVVITERRPVPLEHHYAISTSGAGQAGNDRVYPVFGTGTRRAGSDAAKAKSTARKQTLPGTPNPEVVMLERRSGPTYRTSRSGRRQHSGVRLRPPRRSDITEELRRRKWLPAIYFLFSRNGCDDAVTQLVADGVRLTNPREQERIREIIDERTGTLADEDLEVLGFHGFAEAAERGIAAHHAGMVPVFKEAVEELFVRGLVKICFATETLALGINMPARSVLIERLEKWDGQRHELLTSGQYTQLTGRAGRRGLDERGHAVVLYQRDIDFLTVASLVGKRTEPLRSSFEPSYNMAVNLLRRHTRDEAERLLALSFAQFQADQAVAGDEERIAKNRDALAGYAQNLHSSVGDFAGYWALRRELSRLESAGAKERRRQREQAVAEALGDLQEGDVIGVYEGGSRHPTLAAVVSRTASKGGTPLAGVVTEDRRLMRIGPREFDKPPQRVGRVQLPRNGGPRQSAYRKQVALALRQVDTSGAGDGQRPGPDPELAARIAQLREDIRAHPVHDDPALPEIEVWAHRSDDLLDKTDKLERTVRRRTGSLVRRFERIVGILTDLGYLEGSSEDPQPTEDGLTLAGIYAETDLVLVEALRRGILARLDAPALAAVATVFTHETRLKEPPPPVFPTAALKAVYDEIVDIWGDISAREESAGLPATRAPDPGFLDVTWRWANDADLDDAIGDSELTAGDFVRGTKQVADLLRQVRDATRGSETSDRAHRAAKSLVRGVVAYTGL